MARLQNPTALAATFRLALTLVALQAVVLLMRIEVVRRRKFDAASQADKLLVLGGWTGGTSAPKPRPSKSRPTQPPPQSHLGLTGGLPLVFEASSSVGRAKQ